VVLVLLRDVVGDVEDAVVFLLDIGKEQLQVLVHLLVEANVEGALVYAQGHAAVEELAGAQTIELAHELAGMVIDGLAAFLELIEFLQHGNGEDDVVLVEVVDARAVVEDDVGVEDEDLFVFCHRVVSMECGCWRIESVR
jgi:hypothetical protein